MLLSGFFSAKLRNRQMTWLQCEIEALSIATAVKHFTPYLVQSTSKACVLTDSKPCVQPYKSYAVVNSRLAPEFWHAFQQLANITFLFVISVVHIYSHLTMLADTPKNVWFSCQICSFVRQSEAAVVRPVNITELTNGSARLPYTNRSAWFQIQFECSDFRRTRAHLKQGTRPSR